MSRSYHKTAEMRIITWKCDVQWLDVYSRTECETARDLRMIPFLHCDNTGQDGSAQGTC